MDEVWLRVRRQLVSELEKAGLWPAASEHTAFLAAERARGESLRDDVLLNALAEDDRRWLISPSIFGPSNRRFRLKTPMALSFGYGLSEGMQSLGHGQADIGIAQTCGIFNFGISIFDLLHDAQPRLVATFSSLFDHDVLMRLHSDPSSPRALQEAANSCEEPEIRLLLQTIAAVYERLYALADDSPNGAFSKTASLIAAAYAAETQSAACAMLPPSRRLEISRAKSVLPFAIIDAIGAFRRSDDGDALRHEMTNDIGTIFWLTDDLVDVVGDARSGALNSLLVHAAGKDTLSVAANLARLLEGDVIAETARTIRDLLARLRTTVREHNQGPDDRLARAIACYVRTWIE
jgi:hypothetical protein